MGEPLYLRVQRDLASRIGDGHWRPGDFLPSEQELQDRYRVSRTTIRKAVGDLVAAGLLVVERGNGTRVAQPRPGRPASGLVSFSQTMRSLGLEPGIAEPHACVMAAPADLPGAEAGARARQVVHVTRIHTADGAAVSFSESWLPADLLAGLDLDRLGADSLYATLATLDLHVVEVVDAYGIVLADQVISDALQVEGGASLLLVERTSYAADHRLVETSRIAVRPDRYRPTVITRS